MKCQLNGQGDALEGWLGAWNCDTELTVTNTTLNYNNGEININGGTKSVCFLPANGTDVLTRLFDVQNMDSVYYSMLIKRHSTHNGNLWEFGLKENKSTPIATSYSSGFGLCYPAEEIQAIAYGDESAPSRESTGIISTNDITYFIVGKITRAGADDDLMYGISDVIVNPSTLTEPSSGWTRVSPEVYGSQTLGKINVRTLWMVDGDTYHFDELRIGKTYESVVVNNVEVTGTIFLIK